MTDERTKLIDIAEKIWRSNGRLTSNDSMTLDWAHDELDDWFKKHDDEVRANAFVQARSIVAGVLPYRYAEDAEASGDKIAQAEVEVLHSAWSALSELNLEESLASLKVASK